VHEDYTTSCNVTSCGLVDRYQSSTSISILSLPSLRQASSPSSVVPIYQYTRRHIEENGAVNVKAARSVWIELTRIYILVLRAATPCSLVAWYQHLCNNPIFISPQHEPSPTQNLETHLCVVCRPVDLRYAYSLLTGPGLQTTCVAPARIRSWGCLQIIGYLRVAFWCSPTLNTELWHRHTLVIYGRMDFSWQRDLASAGTDTADPSGRAV